MNLKLFNSVAGQGCIKHSILSQLVPRRERIPRTYSRLEPMNPVGLRCRAALIIMKWVARQPNPTKFMERGKDACFSR